MNVGLYVRVSTAEQAKEGYSIGEQTERLQKYCEAHGWNIYNIYTDAGYSGSNMDRPALKQLLIDAKSGRFQMVVVYKLDRLSRSQKDTLKLIEDDFLGNNVDFISMQENFDTSSPFGRAMIGILAVFAQLEREQIKERMEMGKMARAKEGKWMGGGHVQFGYDYDGENLVVNEYEAMIVRLMFRLILEGNSVHRVSKILNEKGYRTKETAFRDKTVLRMLRSRMYIGEMKYKQEWMPGLQEPLIDIETFDEVQRILTERRERRLNKLGINPGKVNSCLGGILICARCGAHYSKNSQSSTQNGKKYRYHLYTCNSRYNHGHKNLVHDPDCKNKTWRQEVLDELVFNEIKKLSLEPEIIEEQKTAAPEQNEDLIRAEIEKLNLQIKRLMDLYQVGTISFEDIEARMKEADLQKRQLENQLLKSEEMKKDKLSREETIKLSRDFSKVLDSGDLHATRQIITALIEYIELDGEDVLIHWKF